jgi:hypothetical protein
MSEESRASGVDVTDDGNPRTGVHVSQPVIARLARPGVLVGLVLTGLLTMLSMTVLVLYLAPSTDRLTERNDELAHQLDTLLNEQREERLIDDCLTLYRSDIEVAKGVAQVTLGDNLATAILFDTPDDNPRLAQEVFDADTELRESLVALEAYLAIDPPPEECPHPSMND